MATETDRATPPDGDIAESRPNAGTGAGDSTGIDFDRVVAAARAIVPAFRELLAADLLDAVEQIETVGRIVDGWRVDAAAEVLRRADKRRGAASLSFRNGARDGVELLALTAQLSHRTAKQRVGLGAAITSGTAAKPGRYPFVHEAVIAGDIGVDAARLIVTMLQSVRKRVIAANGKEDGLRLLAAAESMLTELARIEAPEALKLRIEEWRAVLDPDGAGQDGEAGFRARAFRLGVLRADGTAVFSGTLADVAEYAAVRELLQSRRRGPVIETPEGGDDDGEHEDLEAEWRPEGDPRTRAQQDHDTFMDAVHAALVAEAAGTAPQPVPHEIVIVATAEQVERREGDGEIGGLLGRLPMPTIEKVACEAGIRLLVTDPTGEPLSFGRSKRLFTPAQRKALLARSHGRCEIGGCGTPTPFLHAHHLEWYGRDHGPTDIDNAVMLCNYHHHLVHSTDAPFRLERNEGGIFAIPKGWTGPPAARHRIREFRWARAA